MDGRVRFEIEYTWRLLQRSPICMNEAIEGKMNNVIGEAKVRC